MTFAVFTWTLAGVSLTATVANIRRKRWCFLAWTATNTAWTAVDVWAGLYAQAALFAVYAGLAVWGWFHWREREGT